MMEALYGYNIAAFEYFPAEAWYVSSRMKFWQSFAFSTERDSVRGLNQAWYVIPSQIPLHLLPSSTLKPPQKMCFENCGIFFVEHGLWI